MSAADCSLQELLYERLDRSPDAPALTFYSARNEHSWITYGELWERAEAVAGGLGELGVGPGSVCVLVVANDEFACATLLAVLIRGALPLLVAPPVIQGVNSHLREVLDDVIERTRPTAVVTSDLLKEMSGDLRSQHPKTSFVFGADDLPPGSNPVAPVTPGADEIAALQLTSGTTGFPRICVWKQHALIAAIDGMAAAMDVGSEDMYLNWTPLYHDMGLVNNFLLCMARSVPLVMMSPFEFVKRPALWLRALHDTGATTTWSPNFGFALASKRARDGELEGVTLGHVKGFWNAAERIHYQTMVEFARRFAAHGVTLEALKTNFGCAENIGGSTFSDPHGTFVVEHVDPVALREDQIARVVEPDSADAVAIVGAGKPHPGITIHILDPAGEPLPDGHVGELALDTSSRMEGYLEDAEASAAAITGTLLKTGDLGYTRGDEFFWTGRVRERINVRGQKVDPSEFETVLLDVPGLREGCFAAFGVDDREAGTQRVVIVSEIREPTERSLDAILDDVRARVHAELGLTIDVVPVPAGTLAKTSSGKRRHRYFHQLYEKDGLREFRLDAATSAG